MAGLLFTCEHASNKIPRSLRRLFTGKSALLRSHRSWDAGALPVARSISRAFKAPLVQGRHSRLVIDLNRSLHHSNLFSEITKSASQDTRAALIQRIYAPFRLKTRKLIKQFLLAHRRTVHFSIHSFTPSLDGVVRNCEIGILYDPQKSEEKKLAARLKQELSVLLPNARIRLNYPYKGSADGHTTHLRSLFSKNNYIGIELELNQAWLSHLKNKKTERAKVYQCIAYAICTSISP